VETLKKNSQTSLKQDKLCVDTRKLMGKDRLCYESAIVNLSLTH